MGRSPLGSPTVRRADPGDVTAIGDVHAAAWVSGFAHLFDPDYLAAAADRRRDLWSDLFDDPRMPRTTVLVAVAGGRLVAFAHFGPTGLWDDHQAPCGGVAEIYGFYAHPWVWGSGASMLLMSTALASLTDPAYVRVCLWTLEGAGRARRFYSKVGFHETGNVQHHDFGGGRRMREVEYQRPLVRIDEERHEPH